jgi:tellurite resistance protein TerC
VIWYWISFLGLILFLLALDLGVFHRKDHVVRIREALTWTCIWIALALLFNVFIFFAYQNHWAGIGRDFGHELDGGTAALQFFAAYIVEKSLSLDNIFVFAIIFHYFAVPAIYQHRVLFWGILGALILRGIMIAAGVVLIERFDWITYVFGAILLFTAYRMAVSNEESIHPENNPLVRAARRLFPVTSGFRGQRFFVKEAGRWAITPMFLVLLVVESTDVLFAIDSIPAVFAITRDPFLVFTSNVFAILGLRALYFALAGVLRHFRFLKHSLVVLLAYVGVKMILSNHYHLPIGWSLAIICSILGAGVIASILWPGEKEEAGSTAEP